MLRRQGDSLKACTTKLYRHYAWHRDLSAAKMTKDVLDGIMNTDSQVKI